MDSSWTRDWSHVPCVGRQILIHCTSREVFQLHFHVSRDSWLFYILGYNPMLPYFVAQIIPALAIGSSFIWLLGPFIVPTTLWQLLFSKNHLFSGIRCSRLILCISCSSLRISCFSKQLLFLLLENGIRNQDLGATCVCCYCSSFILGLLRMVYVYTNLYIYTYQKIFP